MPAADVQYVLDGSVECGHIGGDTHFYLMELATNTNDVVDNYKSEPTPPGSSHWKSLTEMGLYFERTYVDWRRNSPADMHMASFQGIRAIPHIFREMARTAASEIVENKFGGMTPAALAHLDRRFEMTRTLQIMRRTMHRGASDFSGASVRDMRAFHAKVENRYTENRRAYDEAIARLRADMHNTVDTPYEDIIIRKWENDHRAPVDLKRTQARLRAKTLDDRRVIKRSVKFLNRLVGADTTRMFIGGDRIRFEGKHAIYEIGKESNLMQSHGGFRALSVFDKEYPEMLLCQLCINTPGVPLLDHVASLVMHIRSGEEDQILNIGNASNVHDDAYDRAWLSPFLPKKRTEGGLGIGELILPQWMRDPVQKAAYERDVEEMVKVTSKHIFEKVLADFVPVISKAELRFGTRALENLGLPYV